MKKDIAKKWVRALRSKKYRQAKGVLKTKTKAGSVSHCCLGVLCELYQQERKKAKKPLLDIDDYPARDGSSGLPKTNRVFEFAGRDAIRCDSVLPNCVVSWAGMHNAAGGCRREFILKRGEKTFENLAEMNDGGCRFSTIADTIEKYVDKI